MDVVVGDERQIVVDHERKLGDIETARRDVGGHQDRHTAGFEIAEGALPRALTLVAVNDGHFDASLLE